MSERINSNERGAALLFAMGLLALFLLLAMAFAANSLLQRKIAANRSSRSMVEVIADSATERVRTMLFYYQGNVNSTWIDGKADINRLSSYIDITDTDEKKLDGGEVAADLLEVQRLGGVLYQEDNYKQCPYVMAGIAHDTTACPICSNWQLPDWRLVKNKQTASVDEIVGRYAYVMLPPTPRYFVDRDADNLPVWHTFEELISGLTTKNKDNLRTAKREVEIYYPPAPEAYVCNTVSSGDLPRRPLPEEFFKRFNLNRNDWDTVTVEALLESGPVHFYQGTDSGSGFTFTYGSKNELQPDTATLENGIQFLRRVGNDKATFASLAERRQQIAANLIDYCDTEAIPIPTTNTESPVVDWRTIVGGDFKDPAPKYTGNENTLYLDRVGMAVKLPGVFSPQQGDINIVPVGGNFVITPTTRLFGGVVKIYSDTDLADYKLHIFTKYIKIQASLTSRISYTYQYNAGTNEIPVWETGTGTVSIPLPDYNWELNSLTPTDISFGATAPTGSNGYALAAENNSLLSSATYDLTFSKDWLKTQDPVFSANSAVEVKDFTIVGFYGDLFVKQVIFDLSRIVLSHDDKNVDICGSLGSKTYDFAADPYLAGLYRNSSKVDFSLGIGGIWAKDPRQNLNVDDWYWLNDQDISHAGQRPGGTDLSTLTETDINNSGTSWLQTCNQAVADLFGSNVAVTATDIFAIPYSVNAKANTNIAAMPDRNPASGPDQESVTTPAWAGNAANQHLSTAFFRNAPMESLAELGFIHRGAKWETLNLANAAQPGDDTKPVLPSDYDPVTYKYDLTTAPGTSYQQGDGGLLDQVKVSDKNFLYDSYDLNLRDGSGTLNAKFIGDQYYWKLLNKIRLGALQTAGAAVDAIGSQSDGTAVTDLKNSGNTVIADALISRLNWKYETDQTNAPPVYSNRAQMLWYPNNGGRFFDAYTTLTGANANSLDINKALHDELNAKAMEHTTAGGLPTVYRVLVLAQSIRDIGADIPASDTTTQGFSMKMDTDGNETAESYTNVRLGKYEAGPDEITGQLRMVVTFVRDPATGKVQIKDIEYLED